jgi:hypothetical protein
MVPARLLLVAVHALLHDSPLAVVGHEESVEIEIEAVLDSCAVDLRYETAGTCQPGAVETDTFAEKTQFVRSLSGVLTAATADMDAEFVREGPQAALEGADDARGDAGRMPVHAHDGAERLEPERMRQPLQEFVAAVMVDDRLSDDGAEGRHAGRQPRGDTSAVQG